VTETPNTLELLKRVDIFHQVPEAPLLELLATAETVGVEKGDVIFREGEPGGTMYLVVSGAVELTKAVKGDQSQRLALLDRGQIFGELSLFDDLPRSATAQAFVKSTVLRFPGAAFDRLLSEQRELAPHLLRNLVKKLSLRLRDADEEIRELSRARVH
jgi:CRP-like cAMP-binding protein